MRRRSVDTGCNFGPNHEMSADKRSPNAEDAGRISRTRVEQDFISGFETIGTPQFFTFMLDHLRDDCVLVCNCPSTLLQIGGTHQGLGDVMRALRSFFVDFEVCSAAVDDIVIDGAHVVVNYKLDLRHVGTRRTGRVTGMNHYVLDADRKVARLNVFLDNAALAAIGDLLDSYALATRSVEQARSGRLDRSNIVAPLPFRTV